MANPDITSIVSYQDESLFLNQQGLGFDLLIQLNENALSYVIYDSVQKKILCLESFSSNETNAIELSNFILLNKLKSIQINEVRIAVTTTFTTLVPENLYKADKKKDFLLFNFIDLPENYYTFSDNLLHLGAYNIYAISPDLYNAIKLFGNSKVYNYSTPLLDSFPINFPKLNSKSVLIHIQSNRFELAFYNAQQLILFNSFAYKTPEDIAYFTLFTMEQLKISPSEINAIVAGEIEKKSDHYTILYKYIKHLKFAQRPKEITYSYMLDEVPSHFYYLIFNLLKCE